MVTEADGTRERAIRVAEGHARALERIFNVARTVDSKTMSLQYLKTLKSVGQSPSTKFVQPLEMTSILRPFVDSCTGTSGAAE